MDSKQFGITNNATVKSTIIRKLLHLSILPIWFILTAINIAEPNVLTILIILAIILNITIFVYGLKTNRVGPIVFASVLTNLAANTLLTNNNFILYTVIISIMALSDGFSTILPLILKDKAQIISPNINNKTLEGSAIFLIITFIILFIHYQTITMPILLSLLLTLVEYFSDNKLFSIDDNLMIFLTLILLLR